MIIDVEHFYQEDVDVSILEHENRELAIMSNYFFEAEEAPTKKSAKNRIKEVVTKLIEAFRKLVQDLKHKAETARMKIAMKRIRFKTGQVLRCQLNDKGYIKIMKSVLKENERLVMEIRKLQAMYLRRKISAQDFMTKANKMWDVAVSNVQHLYGNLPDKFIDDSVKANVAMVKCDAIQKAINDCWDVQYEISMKILKNVETAEEEIKKAAEMAGAENDAVVANSANKISAFGRRCLSAVQVHPKLVKAGKVLAAVAAMAVVADKSVSKIKNSHGHATREDGLKAMANAANAANPG